MRTLVVVPTFEEAGNITELLQRIRAAAPDVDVLVVDDNSPDGTAKLAEAANDELGHVDVLVRDEKAGLGTAYRAGFAIGIERGYDVIVQMDADLSHDPAAHPAAVGALSDDVGLAIGSRYVPGGHIPHWPWHRRFLSRYGNLYTRLALGLKARDLTSGFRAWKTSTLQNIDYKTHQRHRLPVPDGDGVPGRAARRTDRRDPDHVHRSRARQLEDVRRGDLRRADPGHVVGHPRPLAPPVPPP